MSGKIQHLAEPVPIFLTPVVARAEGHGLAALQRAAQAEKYLFALFWREQDAPTAAMRKTLAAAMAKVADRAALAEINVADPHEKPIVDRFRLDFAPMPLLLAIAPNGVVTAGFPTKVEEADLLDAFATPCTEQCLKAMDDGKLLFVCVQNSKTKLRKQAMKGVRRFARDERFAGGTEIVVVDPADRAEAELLANLAVDPTTDQAVTVFFGPRGRIGQFRGATHAEELAQALTTAMSGFG